MKFQLNGALTLGTLDGANIEILEEVGPENIFVFGLASDEVARLRPSYDPWEVYHGHAEIRRALRMIEEDFFNLLEPGIFRPILHSLLEGGDRYMLLADLPSYIEAQGRVDEAYRDPAAWDEKAIINVARSGKFSADRAIREYAREIWRISPCPVDGEGGTA